jgi:hypothetical protein
MSTGLLQQLADYGAFRDEEQGYVDVDDAFAAGNAVFPSGTSLYVVPRPSRRIGVLVAMAVAILTILSISVIPLWINNQETPSAGTIVPTTPVESTPTTITEFALTPGKWSRVPQDLTVFGGDDGQSGMSSVTVGGPGLVAVGWSKESAAVWTSVDGVTWSRVPYDESVFGGEDISMRSVTVGGPGLVAVGWDGELIADIPDTDAAVWTSVDGVTWSRVPHNEGIFGAAFMMSVTAGGPGLIAVGMDGPWGDGDAAVWTSVDGFTWSRVPHDEMVFGGVDSQVIQDVTVGGPGLVAVGMDGGRGPWDNNPGSNAAVWTSVDGVTWSRVLDDDAVFSSGGIQVMLSVATGGPGLVAVGADLGPPEHRRTPVWTSPDGTRWTRVPDDVTVRGALESVTAGGPGLVAVGSDPTEGNAVWTSVDGIIWSRVPHDRAVFGSWPNGINDVTVGGPGLVAVGGPGLVAVGGHASAAVWVTEEG